MFISESEIIRYSSTNEYYEPLKRKIYHFQNFDHFSNSLSVSQFIPYILSQSLIIDSFCDEGQAFYHSGLIPIIFFNKLI
jgi:hypothetical protein